VATAAASAIKVFPLLVGAETTTDEPLKNACIAKRCQKKLINLKQTQKPLKMSQTESLKFYRK
jgi:hypothetical protein